MNIYLLVTFPILAFALTYIFIAAMLKTPFAQFFADQPDPRKLHEKPVPRIGGMCIIAAFIIVLHLWNTVFSSAITFLHPQLYFSILACSIVLLLVGFLDDSTFVTVRIRHKLLAEFSIAIVAVIAFHWRFGSVTLLSGSGIPFWINDCVAILWIVGIINALNLIDGVNGLAGGIAIIGLSAMAIAGAEISSVRVVVLCLILAGAVLGFLLHNIRPSRVFLGDTGSLFVGAMLGIVSLHIINLSPDRFSLPLCALFVGLPALDVFVAMTRRYCRARDKQQPLMQRLHATVVPDNNHIHHRLINRGYSHLQASFLLYAFGLMFCAGAFAMLFAPVGFKVALAFYLVISTGLILRRLGFGDRFLKSFRRRMARAGVRKASPVAVFGVIDSRGVIAYALERAGASGAVIEKITEETVRPSGERLAALAIYNLPQTPLPRDLDIARYFAKTFHRPAFVISEKIASDLRITDTVGFENIYCKKMPVSIDPLLDEMCRTVVPAAVKQATAAAIENIRQTAAQINPAVDGIAS